MPYNINKLQGKHVLIVGGSSGLGYGVAEAVLAHGGHAYIASSSAAKVGQAVQRLGSGVKGHVVDVNSDESVQELVARISSETQGQGLDHFVSTAGDALPTNSLFETDMKDIKSTMEVRYFGLLRCIKLIYPILKDKGREASITWTTGTASIRPPKGWALLGGPTGAIDTAVKSFAVDLAPVRVNAIIPGVVTTPLWEPFPAETRAAIMEHSRSKTLTEKVADADEVADAYLTFLKCNYITGTELVVDGGAVLQ